MAFATSASVLNGTLLFRMVKRGLCHNYRTAAGRVSCGAECDLARTLRYSHGGDVSVRG